ncbi:MAG TPA: cytochrome P450 [Candidatus Limnocylindrales bacterium]|nr:cytochrome P450 [Candidatus Limnocylindrales bacterium]
MTSPLDLFTTLVSPEGRADPYPLYAGLREHGPLLSLGDDYMIATTYDTVDAVLRDPAFGVEEGGLFEGNSLLVSNPPDHTRMRRRMSGVFTARRVAAVRDAVVETTNGLIDAMRARGDTADIMADFAYRLPVTIICEFLGVPEQDREWFRPVARDFTAVLEGNLSADEMSYASSAGLLIRRYFTALVEARRAEPRDDLVSALAAEREELTDPELLSNLGLLLVAGFETTTNLIGNGLRILFDDPARAAGLSLRPNDFVEEFLRFDAPVQVTTRKALQDTTVGDHPIRQGTYVMAAIASANRDPKRFPDPDRFDPSRPNNTPISFGAGAHFCLGAALARLEAQVAFPLLLQRLPGLRPAGEPTRRPRLVLRGYESMPVCWN